MNCQNETNRGYKISVGDPLPALEMNMRNGEVWTNKNLENKVVVIQFTGSWCSVCRREMPELEEKVWQEFKNEDFLLIGVDTKEPKEKVDLFIEKMKVTYPISYDPDGKIFSDFTIQGAGVTRNIVVDKNGKIVFLTRLYEEKEFNSMIQIIKTLL
ncbi:TlpA family protein disulfide reductase [Flavobacteriales bacterium]|nr:TlpA family protein disulfide reductase [Flavobacteriales bacterium]